MLIPNALVTRMQSLVISLALAGGITACGGGEDSATTATSPTAKALSS